MIHKFGKKSKPAEYKVNNKVKMEKHKKDGNMLGKANSFELEQKIPNNMETVK